MIPRKIISKIKSICGNDKAAFDALIDLLEYEDSGNGKQNIHCKEVIEKYEKEIRSHENKGS